MTTASSTPPPAAGEPAERKRNPFFQSPTGGRVLSAMMLPLFWARPPAGFGVLTTTGRRTGKQRHKCIHVIRDGNRAFVVMLRPTSRAVASKRISAWVLNIRANPEVRLRIREGIFAGRARELSDPRERAEAVEIYCRTINWFDYVECAFHRSGRPTRAKIIELHRSWFKHGIALTIELSQAASNQVG